VAYSLIFYASDMAYYSPYELTPHIASWRKANGYEHPTAKKRGPWLSGKTIRRANYFFGALFGVEAALQIYDSPGHRLEIFWLVASGYYITIALQQLGAKK
jgi:hypothetical protein